MELIGKWIIVKVNIVHCGVDWEVKNSEGKDSGVLEHKVWNPGRMQLKNDKDNVAYGQPGKMQLRSINVSLWEFVKREKDGQPEGDRAIIA